MVGAPGFSSWDDMQNSAWLHDIRETMQKNQWPRECVRCKTTEPSHSVRLAALDRHQLLNKKSDYLILGGVLDNICNSACQSCNANLSTKIGSLDPVRMIKIQNTNLINRIPMNRVVELDINGGEPTASPNYRQLLKNLPESIKIIRVNTNGSRVLPNIERILDRGTQIIITLSLDGVGLVHDYVRWPVKWDNYLQTVIKYNKLSQRFSNLRLQSWTTLHILNAANFNIIKSFSREQNLHHDWAYLESPKPLNLRYKNQFSLKSKHLDPGVIATLTDNHHDVEEFIAQQDRLRGISIKDYI